jgi:RHS repeat-associated protein
MMKRLVLTAGLMLLAALAAAQTPPVTFSEDFQSYGKSKKPDGWIDGKVGDLNAHPKGYFKTAIDPTGDKKGPNIVFGTTKSVGSEEDEKHGRIGYFSTYVDKTFAAAGRFEIQGRVIEMSATGRFGFVVLSGYPATDTYYLIGEKRNAQGNVRLQISGFGAGTPTGTTESTQSIQRGKWYRFRLSADDANNATTIRARLWLDGTPEPSTYQIEATDASTTRLKTGHFGLWSGGRGDGDDGSSDDDSGKGLYIDDLGGHSPSDTTAPVINFYESGVKLDPATTPAFNRDAKIEIRVTDDLSTFSYTAKLDGNPYVSLTPVTTEALHTVTVHAVDAPGNARDATLKFLIDKTKPVVTLKANGNPLTSGTIFNNDVTLSATVQDASAVTTVSKLDNATVTLPDAVAQEQVHQIDVTATDVAGNFGTAGASFTVDKTAPVIAIKANGQDLAAGASFKVDVTLTWTATDLTLNTVSATLDNAAVQSGVTVTAEGQHTLVVTATDKASHTKTETRTFLISKTAPEVTLLANGSAFVKDKTYNTAVAFTVTVHDTLPTTTTITVDGHAYTQGTPVTGDGLHTVQVVVTNSANLSTTVGPFNFTIDTAAPTITMTESGQPFQNGAKFTRDVLPIVTATDALTTNPAIVVTLDGTPYPVNTAINEEKADHVISATATDGGGNIGSVGPFHFMLDKSKPVVTIVNAATGQPFPPDALFNVPVAVKVTVVDITHTTVAATLDGAAFSLGAPSAQPDGSVVYAPPAISAQGAHTLSVVATDEVAFSNDPATAAFTIDTTAPAIAFTDPVPNATVGTITISVSGTADDAQTLTINGRAADVNAAAKTFTLAGVSLLEGRNELVAVATDAAGNHSTQTLVVTLDTRGPEVTITAPAADTCIDTAALAVSGTVTDPHVGSVTVTVGAASAAATVDANGAWSASVPVTSDGKKLITVEATDSLGHATSVSRTVTIDRIAPSVDITEGGATFAKTAVNRPVSLFARAADADPNVVVVAKLDGAAYASGTPIASEGSHTLAVAATDCAGHNSAKSVTFVVDLTPPTIRNLNPANGATVGTMPSSISGLTDADAVSVEISGTALRTTPAPDGSFTIPSVPFAEGSNRFVLVATDRAGNSSSLDYTVIVRTIAPVVEIRESGLPIADGALFSRTVTPVIRSSDPAATVTATLDGAAFTSGTTISADGTHKLIGTATDSFGHAGTAEANFTIDRTPPVVKITAPAAGTVQTDHVTVRGTAGDAISATVNGQPVVLAADGTFVVDSLLLEVGDNSIVANGRDRAGNAGRDEVVVTRDDLGAAVLITYPPDHALTNRPATDVVGRILTLGRAPTLKIGTTNIPVDSTGGFRISGYALTEGENTITVTATAPNGVQNSATTHVTADFTPPSLTILESGQPLVDAARFAAQAVITLQSADTGGGAVTTTLTIDGTPVTASPATIAAAGGHSVIAVARDLAGNETRAERTLFIGTSGGGTADCKLDIFDPANGAVILANSTTLVGRSGGAIGVKVNGVAASVADGAFSATVELPVEGANAVNITCTDAAGAPTGTPVTITLQRVTGNPSITITTPDENFASAQETIAVSGTIADGVVSADVNGVAATITGSTFTVPSVRLAPGLNVVVAHGRNAAGRTATASRRGVYYKDAPSISISAPSANTSTGTAKVTVSGTYSNLDPATIAIGTTPAQFVRASDTTGRFTVVDVPLTSGPNTLVVSGRDRLNRAASATVVVNLVIGTPSIVITAPADHAYFGAGATSVTVNGTFQAAAGATVDVNGVAATITGNSYTAAVAFSTLAGGITPIVARVTEPGGANASAAVTVTQLTAAPSVIESFPAPNAAEVDNGALMLVLFSQPMDVATMSAAFRLEDASSSPVSGTLYLDKDVLTFAPATLLAAGGRYTLRVTTAAKNLAGASLGAEYTSAFTVAAGAPSTPPSLSPLTSAVCGQSITVNGTATPGARVRLDSGTLTLNASADGTGKFSFTYPISGQSGYALVRVSTVGSDGSLSPAAELNVRIDCSGPQVLNASFDRAANKITIQFSEPIDAATANVGTGNAILIALEDGRSVAGTASVSESLVTVTPAENLSAKTITLTVTNAVKDRIGNALVTPYSQTFAAAGEQPTAGDGSGFISGEVYDATTGRPLPAASITIDSNPPVSTAADARGRYVARLHEGAHTIKASLNGYTNVWREIIVPAGAGVVPIDIRLTKRGDPATSNGATMALTHGGDTAVTKKIDLTVPGGALANGSKLTLTAVGAQALTGLLPLGWSPLAAAEVAVNGTDTAVALSGAQLTFNVSASEITAASQNVSAVGYDAQRDEWRVLVAVANVGADGKVAVPIAGSGAYALVYPDKAAGLTAPPLPVAGDVLRGVPAAPPDAPALVKRDFTLNPAIILPTGRAVATLRIEGGTAKFPSGTAVQAYVDEELRLADGSRLLDPPFATDLLLYRTLAGDLGIANFHLGPSAKAAEVVLETGVDHVHIQPYPGRLDRGTLIGSEGGRVPADDKVAIDIPSGAVPEPLRATATSMSSTDLAAIGTVAGFRVVGGFQLTLQRVTEPAPTDLDNDGKPDPVAAVELFVPARAAFTVDGSKLPAPSSQVILAELLDQTPYGRMLHMAVPMAPVDPTQTSTPAVRFATRNIDRSILPVDGIAHEGRYVLLAAEAPMAFATGTVHSLGATGRLLADARVSAPPLGVTELSRGNGIYNIPVPATPASPFTLIPRHVSTGDGAAYVHASSPAADAVVRVDLALVPQPPVLGTVVVLKGDPPSQGTLTAGAVTTDVALTTNIRASFSPGIDPASVATDSITVTDALTGAKVGGTAAADGTTAVVWTLTAGQTLKPNGRYIAAIASTIRGTNGAALAKGAIFNFATVTQVLNTQINRDKIRITIPDAGGVSRISGDPGALPAGWQAVAVRRQHDFIVRYQATAAGDGSFSFVIGNGGDAADKVTIADLIDLRVVNTNGALAGIFSLTPFVSEDGKSLVVPAGAAVRYTTPEGITLDVPAGAFDVPTMVTVAAAKKEDFLDIPSLEAENEYAGSVKVDFDGVANKPLVVELPVPSGFDTAGKDFILAEKGMSLRGPRLAVIDLMRVSGGKFTNAADPNRTLTVFNTKVRANQTLVGSQFSKYLGMLLRSGIFMVLDIKVPTASSVGWAAMEGLQASYDLMWDIFASYYIPHIVVTERGGALLPIITGKRFTVVGIDPGTGLQAFSRTYDPIPVGPPGTVVPIEPAQQNDGGPYPVFAGPSRVELLDLDVEDLDIRSIRNFSVRLSGGSVQVGAGASALPADTNVEVLNVSNGTFASGTASSNITLAAKLGDRIALLIDEHDVDPSTPISVVFNEPVWVGGATDPDAVDTFLHGLLKVEQAPEGAAGAQPLFTDITAQARFTADSGNRRINVVLPSALQREASYRLTLKPGIADVFKDAPGLKLGQGTVDSGGVLTPVGGGNALHLLFHVRKPAGTLASFTASQAGIIRGMDLSGNVLFLASLDGGLLTYDMSNPAVMPPPALGSVPGPPNTAVSHNSVTVDRHNRVYATASTSLAGMFRSYRVEDFVNGGTQIPIKGSLLINWVLGYSQMIGLPSNTVLSDVPESIPYRIKVLLQDDEKTFNNRQEFIAGTGASKVFDYPDDLQKFTVTLGRDSTPYATQRITVENLTLDMRWSADAGPGAAVINNIIARSTDKLRLIRNQKTFAVVAHLGYGIAVYDANAIESNRSQGLGPTSPNHIREKLVLTAGKIARECPNATPDFGIIENYITLDAELRGDESGDLYVYFPDSYRGVLDLRLTLPSPDTDGTRDDSCEQRPTPNTGGLLFRSTPEGHEGSRIQALKSAFAGAAGRQPYNHFYEVGQFHWSISAADNAKGLRGTQPGTDAERDYLLVGGYDYGLIVVDINGRPPAVPPWPLDDANVADIIWIPGGATSVRVYQSANIAVVGDRNGRVVLVDLSRIDERWDDQGSPTTGLFPTAKKALSSPANDPLGIGADDPRIIWKSETGVISGTLAPVFDPETGMIYAGAMTSRQIKTLSAIDPRLRVRVNLGDAGGLSDVGGIVPLGIAPPKDIQSRIAALPACDGTTIACKENASLGAFRLEVALPGNMVDALTGSTNQLQLALESERIAGAITEQTPNGFPRAHLRRTRRDGSAESGDRPATNFTFKRIVPDDMKQALKSQRGYNKFLSPWIVAIADPRASIKYNWSGANAQKKAEAGCESCDRPKSLESLGEADGVYELWTNGRFVSVRPELKSSTQTIFDGTNYAYLGQQNRLIGRFSTIMADTVRPTEALVAAQNADVAAGVIQETTFLHSGEIETSAFDLDAGGRADFNVKFDRAYRSRTIGGSVFGQGWDSRLLQRLRALPNGDVEYRDGADLWRFRGNASGGYDSPKGLFLKLTRTQRGWKMIDQGWGIREFDDLGRILAASDEFVDLQVADSGNTMRYVYDESGRLSQLIDPVQRVSTLSYWTESEAGAQGAYPGLVKQISDWRDRKIDYAYDNAAGTLTKVKLPDVQNTSGSRPTMQYAYAAGGSSFNDLLELRSNLESITDPQEAASGGAARVRFTYDTGSGPGRDHVIAQQWGTGESASFSYSSPTSVTTQDILGQSRTYSLTQQPKDYFGDRAHIVSQVESGIATSSTAFGQLPSTVAAGIPATAASDRTFGYSYNDEGLLATSSVNGVSSSSYTYKDVKPEAPGFVLESKTTTGSGTSVTQQFAYQSGANRSTFLASISADGKAINAPEPSRNNRTVSGVNDSIDGTDKYNLYGLLEQASSSGGTDSSGAGASTTTTYASPSDPQRHQRSLPTEIDSSGLKTTIRYPSPTQMVETDARGIVTTTDFDNWRRPVHITVAGPQLTLDQSYEYDATGRLQKYTRKQGSMDVTTSYGYDVMGRRTSATANNVATVGTVTASTEYQLAGRTIVTHHPGGASTTTRLDGLGRVASNETSTGGSPLNNYFAYDLADNLVARSDLLSASATAYDAQGHAVGAASSDGTKATADVDGWGRPILLKEFDKSGAVVGESNFDFTSAGRLKSVSSKVDSSQTRVSDYTWDGAGRETGVAISGRATHAQFDAAGRLISAEMGSGSAAGVSNVFDQSTIGGHVGTLPVTVQKSEKGGAGVGMALQYDTAANVITRSVGALAWNQTFDQAGNVTSASTPGRAASTYDYDSRGSLQQQTLPGGGTNKYEYHPTGALTQFTDPANEVTQTVTDLVGRPTQRLYKDGTQEKIEWEGKRIKSFTDRQGRLQTFGYNAKGQVETITGQGGAVLDKVDYDDAGRVIRWTNDDAVIEFSAFDLDGHPRQTTQSRYRGGVLVDKYTQDHTWSVHGERDSWTMPTYQGFTSSHPWTASVTESRDAMGNLAGIQRTFVAGGGTSSLLGSDYRNAGRPNQRTVTTAAGASIVRTYGYDDSIGLLNRMTVASRGATIAGSDVTYDGVQKSKARLLGVSGGVRANEWSYDDRSRLKGSVLGRETGSTPQSEHLSAADFRSALDRVPATPADPPSLAFVENPAGGHKIAQVSRGTTVETYAFTGADRTEDGRFAYEYDAKGRLAVATQKGSLTPRRVTYAYNGFGRLIGRRAEYATVPNPAAGDWKLEDRPTVLAADALPADATLVWDPINDRLVSIFKAGASQTPSIDADGGLVRQVIHGGAGYDDPLEVTAADAAAPSGVDRLYPVYDEAGAGSLQVILNESGEVVSRDVAGGPYGEDEAMLLGAALDKVALQASKAGDGKVSQVDVKLRLTEDIAAATLPSGVRLAVLDADGTLVRTSTKAPVVVAGATAQWTFTDAEWTALVDPTPVTVGGKTLTPAAISIAATSSLRAAGWSSTVPVLPAPAWAVATKPVYTSSALPVEVRETLTNVAQWLSSIGAGEDKTDVLYNVPSLLALGTPRAGANASPQQLVVSSGFHAHPFQDPLTGKNYVRSRWFDPDTGVWLTPDPMGYRDSSNLYAFAGGDPVNRRDPTGEISLWDALADGRLTVDELSKLELTDDEVRAIIDSIPPQPEPTSWWGRMWDTRIVPIDVDKDPTGARRQARYILLFRMPAFKAYVTQLYELTRSLNPIHYAFETGLAIGSGREPVIGTPINRADKILEFATYLLFLKGSEYISGRLATLRSEATGESFEVARTSTRPLTSNEKGKLGVLWSREAAITRGEAIIGEETELTFTINGRPVTVRADLLTQPRGESSYYIYIEAKYSPEAPFTPAQKVAIPELVRSGDQGMVGTIGSRTGSPFLRPGQKIRVVFQGDVWSKAPILHR